MEIFNNFLKQINDHDADKDNISYWLNSSFMDIKFCGRQIRNILSAAMAIARAQGRQLRLEDIKMMWQSTKLFQDFLDAQRYNAETEALMRKGQYGTRHS